MSGPYAAGLGIKKRKTSISTPHDSQEEENFSLDEEPTPKRRRITHADAEVIPKFEPEDNTNNVATWLHKIDQLGDVYGWNTTDRQFVMQLRLRGSARRWYDDLDDYNLSWAEWKKALETAFPRSVDYVDRLETMLTRSKSDSETMTKYFHDKLSLLKKCGIHRGDAISCIIRGLPIELQANAKAYQCEDPEQLYYGYLSSLENYKKVEATIASRRSTWRRGDGKSPAMTPSMGVKRCYSCRRVGHEARDCRSQQQCSTCQRMGHTTASCWFAATPGSSQQGHQTRQEKQERIEADRRHQEMLDRRRAYDEQIASANRKRREMLREERERERRKLEKIRERMEQDHCEAIKRKKDQQHKNKTNFIEGHDLKLARLREEKQKERELDNNTIRTALEELRAERIRQRNQVLTLRVEKDMCTDNFQRERRMTEALDAEAEKIIEEWKQQEENKTDEFLRQVENERRINKEKAIQQYQKHLQELKEDMEKSRVERSERMQRVSRAAYEELQRKMENANEELRKQIEFRNNLKNQIKQNQQELESDIITTGQKDWPFTRKSELFTDMMHSQYKQSSARKSTNPVHPFKKLIEKEDGRKPTVQLPIIGTKCNK